MNNLEKNPGFIATNIDMYIANITTVKNMKKPSNNKIENVIISV